VSLSFRDLWPGSRERLLISIAPGELSWIRTHGLLRPEADAKRIVPVDADYGARAWDGVIHALRAETAQWQNDNVAVRIVLSNHFVRYALVPSSDGVSAGEEELALARFHFAKVHGEASRDWNIRLSPAASGMSGTTRLASAVDNALIDALQQSFPRQRQPRLASIQPLLMSVFNSTPAMPAKGAWLVMVEADRTCVALYSGKSWQAVQNVKGEFADAQAWVSLVERVRWSISLDSVPDTILVHATPALSQQNQMLGPWKVIGLQPRWPAGTQSTRDGAYAMALSTA
jgi:hypothetical protein